MKLFRFTLITAILICFAACGGDGTTQSDDDDSTSKTIVSIYVLSQEKTSYLINETIDTDNDFFVYVKYSDNSEEKITDFSISGFDSATTGIKTITIAYSDKTTTITVSINDAIFSYSNLLNDWLADQPDNTPETPYFIALQGSDMRIFGKKLIDFNSKFVYLDLSSVGKDSISQYAFSGCTNVTGVIMISGISWPHYSGYLIYPDAFSGCTNLKNVIIGKGFTSIGGSAFERCTSLESITVPDSVTKINGYAFRDCTSLKSITLPKSLTDIVGNAFSGCTGLTSINIDDSNTAYTSENGILYNKNKTSLVVYPGGRTEAFTIPDGVTTIEKYAFYKCTLTGVTISSGVTVINDYAFQECTNLKDLIISNGVTTIGEFAFKDCTGLTSLIIPDSVTNIKQYAFYNCNSLESLTIGSGVTGIGTVAFFPCYNLLSITFKGTIRSISEASPFYGDLRAKFYEIDKNNGTPGTYTREDSAKLTWTRL